jgi:hypothetical protein
MHTKISLLVLSALVLLAISLAFAQTAHALAEYTIQDDPTGEDCTLIGTWDMATKTCTLNRDLNITITGSNDGIQIDDNNITLDGAGHTVRLTSSLSTQYGVYFPAVIGASVININVSGFHRGIVIVGGSGNYVQGCRVEANNIGYFVANSTGNNLFFSDVVNNATFGLEFSNADNGFAMYNNFIANTAQVNASITSTGNTFGTNYWDTWDSRAEGCINTTPFEYSCDVPYAVSAVPAYNDMSPVVLRSLWERYDWTWYDNIGGDNWVLLANRPNAMSDVLFKLSIGNMMQPLASVPGYSPGYVPPGSTIYNKYEGLIGGPVTATNRAMPGTSIASQRILWPKGGDSLEEVNGTFYPNYDSRLLWTWYDMVSPGYKNWVLISNPNDYQINYNIRIAGAVVDVGTIPANGRVTPSFPGLIGGPVEVNAWDSFSDPVYVMASQRVLSNGDMAFNEQPGQPANQLASHYVWTWYDQASPDARNWVLVANPPDSVAPIYYEVWIGGVKVHDGGPIPPGGNETPTFPGAIGGPVEVKSFSNAGHTIAASSIASQRIIWGPSFGEVMGTTNGALTDINSWTWYDEASAGARNWVLVANHPNAATPIYYEVWIGGVKVHDGGPIPPGGNETPTFPGTIGGPVEVKSFSNAAHTIGAPAITSQRVLWNGYFNETWGQ